MWLLFVSEPLNYITKQLLKYITKQLLKHITVRNKFCLLIIIINIIISQNRPSHNSRSVYKPTTISEFLEQTKSELLDSL